MHEVCWFTLCSLVLRWSMTLLVKWVWQVEHHLCRPGLFSLEGHSQVRSEGQATWSIKTETTGLELWKLIATSLTTFTCAPIIRVRWSHGTSKPLHSRLRYLVLFLPPFFSMHSTDVLSQRSFLCFWCFQPSTYFIIFMSRNIVVNMNLVSSATQ